MNDERRDTTQAPFIEQAALPAQPQPPADPPLTTRDLALRFLVGLALLGGDEAARRLQEVQYRLDADPTPWWSRVPAKDKPLRRRAWHLGLGLMRRGERRLQQGINAGYDLSRRAAGRVSSASTRLAGSRLAQPVLKPLETRLDRVRAESAQVAREGELEEQMSRALATGTLSVLILDILDEVAKNPEMQDFVQSLLGQQGVGMATSMMDNARSVTLAADDAAEGLLRWLLRRTPRRELPPSPVEGQPQKMYDPITRVEGGAPDDD